MPSGLPDPATAERLLSEAEALNPGAWVAHSRNVALAAHAIAAAHPTLDAERAYVLGLLHDIGRRTGPNKERHILDGHDYLLTLGFTDAARIALTHSFPGQDPDELLGEWDGTPEEFGRFANLLRGARYTDEDRLLQLCDKLALSTGCCVLEQRLVDITLRYSFTPRTPDKWRAVLDLKAKFDTETGQNIYRLLPGLVDRLLA